MSLTAEYWSDRVERVLHAYDEELLRKVAGKLFRPRNTWPADELIARTLGTLGNPPAIDRRLKDLEDAPRRLLFLISRSKQPRWAVGNLVEMLVTLGEPDGLAPLMSLLESGLLYPDYREGSAPPRWKSFDHWLSFGSPENPPFVFAHPVVITRIAGEDIPDGLEPIEASGRVMEADGLDWLLRLAVLWQKLREGSLRRTQQRDLFKRDLDRLRADPLLATPPGDALAGILDPGLLALCWSLEVDLAHEDGIEILAATETPDWADSPSAMAIAFWKSIFQIRCWNPEKGWNPEDAPVQPYPPIYLLAMVLLGQLPADAWARPQDVEDWILSRHPHWKERPPEAPKNKNSRKKSDEPEPPLGPVQTFLLSIAYPLKLLQATRGDAETWLVKLSPLGRYVLGYTDEAPLVHGFPHTLLVQPNLEILAYRQGLNPSLILKLAKFATWKTLGAACTLQLEPDSVYKAMESGETAGGIQQLLIGHGSKELPSAVVESLKTWSNKRDRITLYPNAALLEFPSAAELADAMARGVPAVQLGERLALVPTEKDIDYRHFRLTGTRDYHLPPDKCVSVEPDGVTLIVDLARSDLLLETEILRFATPVSEDRQKYRITPASAATARNMGLYVTDLDAWFQRRSTGSLPAAARLLFAGCESPPGILRRQIVLHLTEPEIVDGLLEWPATASLIEEKLGPQTISVTEENLAAFREKLAEIGMVFETEEIAPTTN